MSRPGLAGESPDADVDDPSLRRYDRCGEEAKRKVASLLPSSPISGLVDREDQREEKP